MSSETKIGYNKGKDNPNYKGIFKKKCLKCNNEFQGMRCHINKKRFCSQICSGKYHLQNKRKNINFGFKKGNNINKGRILTENERKSKSMPGSLNPMCGKHHSIEVKNKCREARMGQVLPKSMTSIEIKIKDLLELMRIPYQSQKSIMGITQPDFFIEPNICIYCDGDYWHSRPEVIERDKRINEMLKFAGYKVIRLTETKINKEINNCMEIIKNG